MKQRNLVAKHLRTFNKPSVQRDRKRAEKRGYIKHSKAPNRESYLFWLAKRTRQETGFMSR